jgi:hypothetical protein
VVRAERSLLECRSIADDGQRADAIRTLRADIVTVSHNNRAIRPVIDQVEGELRLWAPEAASVE